MISEDNKLISNNKKGYKPIIKKPPKQKSNDWRAHDNWLFPSEPPLKRKEYKKRKTKN